MGKKNKEPVEQTKTVGDVELRFDRKGWIDEVVLMKNGTCVFHLEYLENGEIYLGVDDVQIWLRSANTIRAFYQAPEHAQLRTHPAPSRRQAR